MSSVEILINNMTDDELNSKFVAGCKRLETDIIRRYPAGKPETITDDDRQFAVKAMSRHDMLLLMCLNRVGSPKDPTLLPSIPGWLSLLDRDVYASTGKEP